MDRTGLLGCIERVLIHVSVYHKERDASTWAEKLAMTLMRMRMGKIGHAKATNILRRLASEADRYDTQENPGG